MLTRLAAQVPDSSVIELQTIKYFDSSTKKYFFLSTPKDSIADKDISSLHFIKGRRRGGVPDAWMEKDCFIKFTLHNGADTAREVCFTPGYYLKVFRLYSADPKNISATLKELPDDESSASQYAGCRLLKLEPHETRVYFGKFNFLRTQINLYAPYTIEKPYVWSWIMSNKTRFGYLNSFTYMASGIFLLMIFYSLAVYAQNRHQEFIYYSAYVFCTGIMLFLKSFLDFNPSPFNMFFEEYLDFIIICVGVFFYLGFIRKFLNTGAREPFLEMILKYTGAIFFILIVAFSIIYFFTDKYIILNILENYVIKLLIFVMGIIVVVYSFKKKDPLLNYLAAGNIALVIFSLISLGMMIFKWTFIKGVSASIFNRSLFYYEVGLICELSLFLFGLAYKNKIDIIAQVKEREQYKMEIERREFEKQMAMMAVRQEERDRISADMHDDLGSGVTAIRLMSEIVKSKMNTEQYPEIDKISNSANELLGKMNAIIWTMKSSNDTLESLVAYLRAYATEYFDGTNVDCIVEVSNITERELSGEKRRNIFLSFKETLNNILKHAKATGVRISISANENKLDLTIRDNGVGIDLKNVRRFGNGLTNIKKRMQSIDGDFVISQDNGTLVNFMVNLESD
jgi:signal transduction histidine kinase